MEDQPQPVQLAVHVPPELQTGRYANLLGVWHTAHEFTLDFSVTMPVTPADDSGAPPMVPCEVVARVKVAPSLVFELMRALNENMTGYEQAYGEIRRPETPSSGGEEHDD
jgi:hypothetical protein